MLAGTSSYPLATTEEMASTGMPKPANNSDAVLTPIQMKEHLLRHFQKDERFKPFIALLDAVDNPALNFQSPEVQQIIHSLDDFNAHEGYEPPKPVHLHAHPFAEALDVKLEHVSDHFAKRHLVMHKEKEAALQLDQSVQSVEGEDFKNWGGTVEFKPSYNLVVRTVEGVRRVVKWAAQAGKRVRVAGFRHSWTQIFGKDGDVIMMFLPFDTLATIPYKPPPADWQSELTGQGAIKIVQDVNGRTAPTGHAYCRIMAGVTNDQFRQWCFDNPQWSLPMNIVATEITFGGSNAAICHGAGLATSTLSDIAVEIVYVDAKGELQTVTDAEELLVASGCFGLLGPVVSVTLQLDAMAVAEMRPYRSSVFLTIPPPEGYPIPEALKDEFKKLKPGQLEKAKKDFIARCENDYYLEWFWFPYQDDCWVNTWQKRPTELKDVNMKTYPDADDQAWQVFQANAAQTVVNAVYYLKYLLPLEAWERAWILGALPMLLLPHVGEKDPAIEAYVSDALHFRRGIQDFQCLSSEWEIPVPKKAGKMDYEVIQRAWWDGISIIYARKADAPVRIALEMRLTGGSHVYLAPQRGHDAYASIEFVTTINAGKEGVWAPCAQAAADKWSGYDLKDEQGKTLWAKPHWAKEWEGLEVRGKSVERYLREDAYREGFGAFREGYRKVVEKRGGSVEESLGVFGNDLMRRLIFE